MQEVLSIVVRALVLLILLWRLGHTVTTLNRPGIPSSQLKWFGVDGLALGLAGGVLVSAGWLQTLIWGAAAGALFYLLAALGMNIKDDDSDSTVP
ncbi:MAG: hypothetical protein ACRD1T_02010 [Acidimicrobiia bacterium]